MAPSVSQMGQWTCLIFFFFVGHAASQVLVFTNLPERPNNGFLESVKEDSVVWCCLKAENRGAATNTPITYTMDSSHFAIGGAANNALVVRAPIDREETANIKVTVTANTKSLIGEPITLNHEIYLVVLDANDNIPFFTSPSTQYKLAIKDYLERVREDTPIGTVVFSDKVAGVDKDASATYSRLAITCDPDGDDKSSNTARAAEAKLACETFSVTTHQLTGNGNFSARFKLEKKLNFREKEKYVMTLKLNDFHSNGSVKHSVSALLVIEVIDIQNEPPVCYKPVVAAKVKDGTAANFYVEQVQAEDLDMENPLDKNPLQFSIAKTVPSTVNMFKLRDFNCTQNQQFPKSYCTAVITNALIDREAKENVTTYTIHVLVKEIDKAAGKYIGYNTTCIVIVNIEDVNDNPPKLHPPMLTINITEGHRDAIFTLEVHDADKPQNARFNLSLIQPFDTFRLEPDNPHQKVMVGQVFPKVTGRKYLDYEVPAYRQQIIKIVAKELSTNADTKILHTTTGTYTINIIDENDNAPVFAQKEYSVNVKENSPNGTYITTITATDKDSAKYGPLQYRIEGDSKQRCSIDANTGRIVVSGNINYEDEPKFNVFVVATDAGKKEVTVKLVINVIDQNDVNPVFDNDLYRTKIYEKETKIDPAVTVKATDKETGRVTYSIVAGNTKDNAFQVDRNTGVFSVTRPLHYNEAPSNGIFNVKVEANDGGTPPGTANSTVRVQVVDINDFPPVFKQGSYIASVKETAAPETQIVRVSAVDNDGGVNGRFQYRINTGSNDQFFIRTDGWIIVAIKAKLDYDVQKQYHMVVDAVDNGAPQKTGSCNVLINVLDMNNKKPQYNPSTFYKTISADALENTLIENVRAVDKDTNAKLSYRIPWGSFIVQDPNSRVIIGSQIVDQVTVNNETGKVYLRRNLRPDGASQFSFVVTAEDLNAEPKGTQTATATVIVSIFKDEGETPTFNSPWTRKNPVYTLYIPEEQGIGSLVLALSSWDPKAKTWLHNFAKVPGSDPNNFFKVGKQSGEVHLDRRVDYETINPKVIKCMVSVSTVDGRRATALIIVNVQDINDNSPKFALQQFTFSLLENAPYRSIVGNVRATDIDSGNFGQIVYSLSGKRSQDFMIDMGTGNLLTRGGLDREAFPKYELLVTAVDNPKASQGRKSGIAAVTIILMDVNDNAPLFERSEYNMYTMESTPLDTSLGKVLATDKDEGTNAQIFYSIAGGNALGFFKIDQIHGVIRTATSLRGHHRGAPYDILVEAIDNGVPTRLRSIATVHVTIQDPGAFIGRPTFTHPTPGMIKSIPEEQPIGYFVLQCKATDSDGPLSALRYNFLQTRNPDHAKFKIDALSGNLTTAAVLDREKQAQYDLQIAVTDGTGNFSTIMLMVRLIDIDDNPPSFFACNNDAKDPLLGKVYENVDPPKYVRTVHACDLDAVPNNLIFFKITCGNEMGHFTIGLRNGNIHTNQTLDREKIPKYTLCVTVYSADPRTIGRKKRAAVAIKSATIGVIIEVLDRDDSGPTYIHVPKKTFTTGLLINAPYNSLVIDAKAFDPDTAPNSVTFYKILNMQFMSGKAVRSAPGAFQVDMTTGEVRTSIASYSDYTNGHFNILIQAYDKEGRNDNATVLIYVLTQSQRLKFIFSRTPSDVRSFVPSFMSDVSYVVKSRITTDLIRFSVGDAADFDFQRTDVCFHMVKENNIVLYNDAVSLLSSSNEALKKIYDTYGMSNIGLCNIGVKTYTRYTEISFWWVIIILALFLFFFVLILVLVIICLWNRYRKFMLTNTSYIVRMGTDGQLKTSQVQSIDSAVVASAIAASQMSTTEKTTKISYDEVDIGAPVIAPVGGTAVEEVTTVFTKTSDGGYHNYGYDNQEGLEMSSFRAPPVAYDNVDTTGIAESATTTTTTTERTVSGAVSGGTVVTGAVLGGPVTGGTSTTVTKETTNLEVPAVAGTVVTDMRTINAGGTPTVMRKIITTTTTVTEEVVEEPAPEASGVVITEVTGDAQPLPIDQRPPAPKPVQYTSGYNQRF